MMQLPAATMLQSPPQPELCISNVANAICVRWSTIGIPAASYVVELRQGSTSVSSRFSCQAPTDGSGSLELCVHGLQSGESYTACVRSVAQGGFESAPSPWSCWVTVPVIVLQSYEHLPGGNTSVPHMPSSLAQQQSPSPYSILFDEVPGEKPENQFGMVKICSSPEVTNHDDALFLD
jgi:hypothetical protein